MFIAPSEIPLLAKNAATLDAISKGRLELGVGLGWQKEEFDTAGVSFERAEIFWENLDICKLLWEDSPVSFLAKTLILMIFGVILNLLCKDLPLLFGLKMTSENASVAKVGHGWIPIKTSREFISEGKEILSEAFF